MPNLDLDDPSHLPVVIRAKLPTGALVLVDSDFIEKLARAEERVASLKITDQASAQAAAELQRELTKAGTSLEECRQLLLRPLLDTQAMINEAARGTAARIELAKRAVKVELTQFADAQRRLAEEAERKRLADIREQERKRREELERLERQRLEEQQKRQREAEEFLARQKAEEQRRAAEEAAKKPVVDLDAAPPTPPAPAVLDEGDTSPPVEPSELDKQIIALRHTPIEAPAPIVAPKLKGVSFRTWVEIVRTDVALLPDPFVNKTANTQAIRAAYIAGWKDGDPLPVCPGVVFEIKRETITR